MSNPSSVPPSSRSPELASRFSALVLDEKPGEHPRLPYRLLTPLDSYQGQPAARAPLVVLLHGAGERGDDNRAQLKNGAAELLGDPVARRYYPCYFALPQCPEGRRWVEVDWTAASHSLPRSPSGPLAAVLALIAHLKKSQPIDPDRVYVIGLSMGGYGVWDLISRGPEQIAAAVAVCGGGDESQAPRLVKPRELPLWAFHGARDEVVPVTRSRKMIEALKRAGGSPRYTEYPDVGHDAWVPAFREPQLLPWLFAQRRPT